LALTARVGFSGEQALEKVGEARLGARRILGYGRPIAGDAVELQITAQGRDAFMLEVHAGTSSSA
jgi:hypothetical protein